MEQLYLKIIALMFPLEEYKLLPKKIQSDENYCTGGNQA